MIYCNNSIDLIDILAQNSVCATIGNFDGLHIGHRSLIHKVFDISKKHSCISMVISFWPHPLSILAPHRSPRLIATHAEKLSLLEKLNIDVFLELPFTKHLASLTAEEFFTTQIFPINLKYLVIGYDFCLGKNRAGDADCLRLLGEKYTFDVIQMPAIRENGTIVSSTLIRKALNSGSSYIPGMPMSIDNHIYA